MKVSYQWPYYTVAMKAIYISVIISLFALNIERSPNSVDIYGEVTYDYYVDTLHAEETLQKLKIKKPETYSMYGDNFRRSTQLEDDLKFSLRFNEKRSIFEVNQQAGPTFEDNFDYSTAVIMATEAKDTYYLDHDSKTRLSRAQLQGSAVNIIEPYQKYTWTLTGEEKCVGGRTLLKATTLKPITESGNKEGTKTVHAWYAPDIPVPFGPLGYDGLPGLIMEVRFGPNFVRGFTAIKVDIGRGGEAKPIRKPKALADITEGDFQRKMLSLRQQRGK